MRQAEADARRIQADAEKAGQMRSRCPRLFQPENRPRVRLIKNSSLKNWSWNPSSRQYQSSSVDPPSRNRDVKSLKLRSFVDEKMN